MKGGCFRNNTLQFKCLFDRCYTYLREVEIRSVDGRCFDHTIVDLITTAKNLTALKLYNIPLTVPASAHIGQNLPMLGWLKLARCFQGLETSEAEQAFSAILKECRFLKILDVAENETLTGDTSFAHLPPTLHSLEVWYCSRLHPSAIDHVRSLCVEEKLRELDVSFLPIDGPILAMGRLFEGLPLLEKLEYNCGGPEGTPTPEEVTAAMVKIGALNKLRSLNLNWNPLVTDEVLEAIVDGCEKLEEFTLDETRTQKHLNYTSASLQLLAGLPKLTSLSLGNISGLNDEVLLAVVTRGRLRKLRLRGCKLVTDLTIRRVLQRCGHLRELDISNCRGVTRETVMSIGEFLAAIAANSQSSTTESGGQNFQLWCYGSSIEAQPGELAAELLATHPALKFVRQQNSKPGKGEEPRPSALHIRW